MDTAAVCLGAAKPPPLEVMEPRPQRLALVVSSPHSGTHYPAEFLAASRLDPVALRRSEDSFIDDIFGAAPALGAPLLRATFPRAYLDPNREPYELDPAMFADALPGYANTRSPRVAAGLGTIARVVATGREIYRDKLRIADALERIHAVYQPYHGALRRLIAETRDGFGCCLLVDAHSMPSVGGPMDADAGRPRVDMILGDVHGASCACVVTDTAERALRGLGYAVTRNNPYSGGFTTQNYGRPRRGIHALQIEVNRALYMDEETIERKEDSIARLKRDMRAVLSALGAIDQGSLAAA
ncbi:MAG: N-formylglutamate amidohydrolase [Rhodospirillales bacterium]